MNRFLWKDSVIQFQLVKTICKEAAINVWMENIESTDWNPLMWNAFNVFHFDEFFDNFPCIFIRGIFWYIRCVRAVKCVWQIPRLLTWIPNGMLSNRRYFTNGGDAYTHSLALIRVTVNSDISHSVATIFSANRQNSKLLSINIFNFHRSMQ